jgi:hypothetical protein
MRHHHMENSSNYLTKTPTIMSRKLPGSELLGTKVINVEEFVLMAKVMKADDHTPAETNLMIHAIDDMLSLQRMRSIMRAQRFTASGRLRKDSHMSDFISSRVDQLITDLKEENDGKVFQNHEINIEP